MAFLKYLFGPMILMADLPAEGVDGWYIVENSREETATKEEDEEGIWQIFVKDLEGEKILVRFPNEPTYRYLESGDLEITAKNGENKFQLLVSEKDESKIVEGDVSYPVEGRWIHTHFEHSDRYIYRFQVENSTPENQSLRDFFSTFSIEKIG